MTNDPFDEFEFKPLTEGLGFHKKAEKIKSDMKSSQLAQDKVARSVPDMPPRSLLFQNESLIEEPSKSDGRPENKTASQSISDLIASLPPSLDFLDSKDDTKSSSTAKKGKSTSSAPSVFASTISSAFSSDTDSDLTERPQIFQPLARQEYKAPAGQTIGQVLGTTTTASTMPSSVLTSPVVAAPTLSAPTMATPTTTQPGNSPYRERLDESFAKAFPHVEKTRTRDTASAKNTSRSTRKEEELIEGSLKATAGNPVAAVLDGMVISGVATILLVCILAITKVNLVGLLSNAQTDGPTQIHLALLFAAVLHIYYLTARSFFGSSMGEWAFDIQLGTNEEQKATIYPLKVAARILILTLTGFVVIPLISLIMQRDLMQKLTGLQLYRRV